MLLSSSLVFFSRYAKHRSLHSFPTRRSSDLATVSYSWAVTKNGAPYASGSDSWLGFTPDDNGTYVVTFTVDRKSTRLNSSHRCISYAVFCLKKKNKNHIYLQF